MPTFKLNADKVVTTKGGHAIRFIKGEPTHVPHSAYAEVMAAGAQPTEELPAKATLHSPEPADPLKRKAYILDVLTKMVAKNTRGDFTANGVPNLGVLNEHLGFRIETAERDSLWLEHQTAK